MFTVDTRERPRNQHGDFIYLTIVLLARIRVSKVTGRIQT